MRNSGKFIILEKMLRQFVLAERQKVIIFSGFDQALNLCEDVLTHVRGNARGSEYARIDGSTLSAWRNLAIYLFNNDPRYKVFLISIRAGGEGLNLASASRVIFLDEDRNPQVMRQAEARAHRLGQTKPVTIFKIHSRGTVEEQMVGRLAKKAYLGAKVTENMQTPNSLDELTDMAELKEASNSTGSAAVIVSFIESLMRQKRLSDNQIDTNTLLSWDWATILQNCTDVQSGERDIAESITEEDEQAWLERKERIKTNVFNGAKVEKTTSWRHPVADSQPELTRAERRIGKQRIVLVDGYEVTKDNLSLSEQASPASASSAKPKERIVHDPVSPTQQTVRNDLTDTQRCFLCHQDGGDECQECPRSFHRHCLETEPLNASPYKERYGFMCPHHYCAGCQKTASQAGQLLYSCRSCTRAYCEQCLDWSNTVFIGTDVYEAVGYVPKSAFYTECAACRTRPKRKDPFGGGFSKRTRLGS
jgi:SWI/SNF-related matrix-associated actin-dependent regulator of chromatin subfamily A member 5